MPGVDKLVFLSKSIKTKYRELAERDGKRKGGYSRVIDLSKTGENLPVILYCGGIHDGTNKIQFVGVAHIGLKRVREIAAQIIGNLRFVRIYRIDLFIDLPEISVLDFALYARLARAQNCSVVRSRSGITFYLRRSEQRVVMIYDRLARLRSIRDPLAKYSICTHERTRVEVQLKGRGLPFRQFSHIARYADLNLLSELSFWELPNKRPGLTTTGDLAADGLLHKIDKYGLQVVSKMYPCQKWAYLQKTFLVPASQSAFPDLNKMMRSDIRAWLEDQVHLGEHIRFPRLRKKSKSQSD